MRDQRNTNELRLGVQKYLCILMGSRPKMNVCVALLSKYNALSLFLTQMYEWFVAFIDNWDGIKS